MRTAAGLQVDTGNSESSHLTCAGWRLHTHSLDQFWLNVQFRSGDPDRCCVDGFDAMLGGKNHTGSADFEMSIITIEPLR